MFEMRLTEKMVTGAGYTSRPLDKPIISRYRLAEVNMRFISKPNGRGKVLSMSELKKYSARGLRYTDKPGVSKRKHVIRKPQRLENRRYVVPQIYHVSGLLKPCITTTRGGAPLPASGTEMRYTPNDKGHVIALQLGGVDHSFNIVPQLRNWQQHGTWRQMELDILRYIEGDPEYSHRMDVEIKYGRSPVDPKTFRVKVTRVSNNHITLDRTLDNLPDAHEIERQDIAIDNLENRVEDNLGAGYSEPSDMVDDMIDGITRAIPASPGQWAQQMYRTSSFFSDEDSDSDYDPANEMQD